MNPKLGPPAVEPLSDVTWARIERDLWSRLDTAPVPSPAPRSWRPWIVGGLATAVAIVLVILARSRGDTETVQVAQETVPTRMVSGAGPSALTYGDAHITLEPESALVMTQDPITTTAILERGSAWFSITHRKQPFVVMAGDAMVRVVGTRFRVTRMADHARVEVERGIVEVRFRGTEYRLVAGQHWSSGETTAVIEPPPVIEPPLVIKLPPVIDPPTKPATKPLPPTPLQDPRATFERLSALEATDPSAAIAGYVTLANGSDRWAELALYAAGRIATDRRDARARSLLDTYLRRFPRGANADDARELLGHLKGLP